MNIAVKGADFSAVKISDGGGGGSSYVSISPIAIHDGVYLSKNASTGVTTFGGYSSATYSMVFFNIEGKTNIKISGACVLSATSGDYAVMDTISPSAVPESYDWVNNPQEKDLVTEWRNFRNAFNYIDMGALTYDDFEDSLIKQTETREYSIPSGIKVIGIQAWTEYKSQMTVQVK